eukprot:CAMPEP_0206527628 /NCGR_PEP_ID=MMETSP0325_2-20121206/1462_1 /ASSEMBLY_ACC=CAM_ASM_000347 /TAXON_ID=2866 /ORGANISM="Crypthecodinium cohnii, Strain Seligo" /LENGTH=1081 /DNA_ID=CAMNT_0054023075 /DNA_START=86 /DNA_END=3331 /DNA_ORIENTATION=-
MEDAGLLLRVTCGRLARSCKDMQMLLTEFQEEQALLLREQARLYKQVEKFQSQAEVEAQNEDQGLIWGVLNEVHQHLPEEVTQLFRAKEEQKAAQRRGWIRSEQADPGPVLVRNRSEVRSQAKVVEGEEGLFSEMSIQASWANDVMAGTLRPCQWVELEVELDKWIREAVSGDPVAEAEEGLTAWHNMHATASRREAYYPPSQQRTMMGASPSVASSRMGTKDLGSSPKSWTQVEVESLDLGEALRDVSGQLPRMVRAPVAALAGLADVAGDWANSLLPAEAQPYRKSAGSPRLSAANVVAAGGVSPSSATMQSVLITVTLSKPGSGSKWGLQWEGTGFKSNKERVVERLQEGSEAEAWNLRQENPDLCIRKGDRLVSANGRTAPREIKEELAGREVVLVFQRLLPLLAPHPSDIGGGDSKATPRRSFRNSFSDYLKELSLPDGEGATSDSQAGDEEAKSISDVRRMPSTASSNYTTGSITLLTPIPEGALGTDSMPNGTSFAVEEEDDEEEEAPLSLAMKRFEVAAAALAAAARADNDDAEEMLPPPTSNGHEVEMESSPPKEMSKEAPSGVIAQVMSRSQGSVRLSWLFSWVSAPRAALEAGGRRAFEVVHTALETHEEEVHPYARSPMLSMTLKTGSRYHFKVRAVILKPVEAEGNEADADAEKEEIVWSSSFSEVALADLRALQPVVPAKASSSVRGPFAFPTNSTVAAAESMATLSANTAASASPANGGSEPHEAILPPNKSQETNGAVDAPHSGATLDGDVSLPSENIHTLSPAKQAPRRRAVAASLGTFLEHRAAPKSPPKTPEGGSSHSGTSQLWPSPTRSTGSAGLVMGGSKPSPTKRAMSPLRDPQAALMTLRGRTQSIEATPPPLERQRSTSIDSDDEGSLLKLVGALQVLENTSGFKPLAGASTAMNGGGGVGAAASSSSSPGPGLGPGPNPDKADRDEPVKVANPGQHEVSERSAASGASSMPSPPKERDSSPSPLGGVPSPRPSLGRFEAAEATRGHAGSRKLNVQLTDEQVSVLEFTAGTIDEAVKEFVDRCKLKAIFIEHLVARCQAMVSNDKLEEAVDIIELLE